MTVQAIFWTGFVAGILAGGLIGFAVAQSCNANTSSKMRAMSEDDE